MLKSLLHDDVKVNIIIDDIRLRTNLTTSKRNRCIKKSFSYIILGFTQSHSGVSGDIEWFIQKILGRNKNLKSLIILLEPIQFT